MAKLSISEAARRAGVQRSTLYRQAKAGKLSIEITSAGEKVIDLSELLRIYPDAATAATVVRDGAARQSATADATASEAGLDAADRRELALLRERIAELVADKEDLRRRLDAAEAERRTLLQIADQRARPGWLGRLFGGK